MPPSLRTRPRVRAAAARALGEHGPLAVVVAALSFMGWCTLTTLSEPGLHYDETLFADAALGGHYAGGAFVTDRFHGIPTMVMPYIGALKAWLYAPILALFGGSAASMRLPVIGVFALTVVLAFAFGRHLFGPWIGALLAVLMATDPAFMTMAKADWGPVALAALFRVGALAAYFTWLRTRSARYLWLLGLAVVLGLFNKIDYLSFAAPLALAALLVHRRRVVACVRARPLASALAACAYGSVLLVEYHEIFLPARHLAKGSFGAGFLDRVSPTWSLLRVTMDGSFVYQFMTRTALGEHTAIAAVTSAAVVLAALVCVGVAVAWMRRRGARRDGPVWEAAMTCVFFFVLLLGMIAALVGTPDAVGPHHAMLLWPGPALLSVALVRLATAAPSHSARLALAAPLVVAVLWLAATQVRVADAYRSGFASGRSWDPVWSTDIYPLARAVQHASGSVDAIVTADWGFGNQLLVLGDDAVRRRVLDAWGTFAGGSQDAIDALGRAVLAGHRSVLLLHARGADVMPGTHDRALALLRRLHPARGARLLYRGREDLAYVVDDRPRGG